jgi:hypothetical protein
VSIFELDRDRMVRLEQTTFGAEGVQERKDLQRLLRSRIRVASCVRPLMLLVRPAHETFVNRIDATDID